MKRPRSGSEFAIYMGAALLAVYLLGAAVFHVDFACCDSRLFLSFSPETQAALQVIYFPVAYIMYRLAVW